jgi:hypothetical protein
MYRHKLNLIKLFLDESLLSDVNLIAGDTEMLEAVKITQPNWYTVPRGTKIRYENGIEDAFGEEIAIKIKIGEIESEALVPLRAVNQTTKVVQASVLGEEDDWVLISLPTGSLGRKMIKVKRSSLHEVNESA